MAGVQNPDAHLDRLRLGPIGGTRGVFPDQLPNYLRGLFPRWRTWEETDRAKAAQKSPNAPAAPVPASERIPKAPAWIRKSIVTKLKAEGRDVRGLVQLFERTHHIHPSNLDIPTAAQAFEQFIERVRKEAA